MAKVIYSVSQSSRHNTDRTHTRSNVSDRENSLWFPNFFLEPPGRLVDCSSKLTGSNILEVQDILHHGREGEYNLVRMGDGELVYNLWQQSLPVCTLLSRKQILRTAPVAKVGHTKARRWCAVSDDTQTSNRRHTASARRARAVLGRVRRGRSVGRWAELFRGHKCGPRFTNRWRARVTGLLLEVTRAAVFVDELEAVVFLKLAHRRADPFTVGQLRDAAVPGCCEASLCI